MTMSFLLRIACACPATLAESGGIWGTFRRSPAGGSGNGWAAGTIIVIVIGVIGLTVALTVVRKLQESRLSPTTVQARVLFSHALKWLGVGLPMRIVLRRAARWAELSHPTAMLLSAELYEQCAGGWADQVAFYSMRGPLRRAINELAGDLFIEGGPALSAATEPGASVFPATHAQARSGPRNSA